MIITRHEGLQIYVVAVGDEYSNLMRETAHKLKVCLHNIPEALYIATFSTTLGNPEKYTIRLNDGIDLSFDDLSIAVKYFEYLSNYEANKDLDILKENSSWGI